MNSVQFDVTGSMNSAESTFSAGDVFAAPLSFAQRRLWFLHQLDPGSAAYNIQAVVRIEGKLDIPALEQSLNEVVRRHETLRTSFVMAGEQVLQVITPELKFKVEHFDLRELPRPEREGEVYRLAREAAQRPFDLEQPPLLIAKLLWLDFEEHVLVLMMDHIVSDGWSIGLLINELSVLYQAYSTGESSPLPELEIQYVDYAQWQREWLTGDLLNSELEYWKRKLAGHLPVLDVPADRPAPPVQSDRGATEVINLPRWLTAELKSLSQRQGATLFMTLLAAFQALLCRYTAQADFAVGTPVAGRTQPEMESLIGCFVNTLVLRADLSGDPPFLEILKRVRETTLEAHAHQDVPFELLVEELQPERSMSHGPLFQVMLVLHPPLPEIKLRGLAIKQIDIESETAKFDLMFSFREELQGLTGILEYRAERFDRSTIKRMGVHFQQLLEGIVADPSRQLSALPLLSAGEREQVLREWNETTTVYPRERCVHELFEEQVEVDPEAVALVCGGVELSYEELNGRANQLAHYLRGLGVGAEVVVGLCLERSVEMVVGVLGILKAGGAYLPLDPQNPLERLRFMLEDGSVPVLLTQEHLLASLPTHWSQVICLDTDWGTISQCSRKDPGVAMTADNLAYVMYTSGSTGTPKGVSVVHRNIVRLVKETDYVEFGAEEVFLQMAPLSFDASTFELWGSLLNGAKLVIMAPQLPTLAELGEVLERYEVTTLWLTAGLFHLLVDEGVEHLGGVRQLLAGGDALSVAHVKRVLAGLGEGRRLINGYGPTEGTTFSCCHGMEKESQIGGTVPIGRPIANTEVYVLDERQQAVPVGVAGELYIGGDGLARGYLNRPELTAKKFVPHPFSAAGGARLYRTGDRVRFLAGGEIEFLGRLDQQVKIRGYRIELGEIEACLAEYSGVREAVAMAETEGPGEKRLVAYVVWHAEQLATISDLKIFLQRRLPEYMVPSAIIVLDEMPLTANGKVDRRALPAVETVELGTEFVAPRTPIEELLAGIWGEVLNVERVGATDDFFELGGHSLLATQLLSRVRDTFQVEVPLRHVFEQPTLAEFAVVLNEALGAERAEPAPPLVPVLRQQLLPLSFAQQRLWFIDRLISGTTLYNIPVAVKLSGRLNVEALEHALSEVVRRHEVLRTTFVLADGIRAQVVHPPEPLRLVVMDLREVEGGAKEAHVRQIVEEDTQQPFDLASGPLLRASLVRVSEEEHIALITMHHIVTDGWSMGILVREVKTLYEAFADGKPSPLPELAIQYADFASWEQSWLSRERLERDLSYWSSQLEGAPAVLELPVDRPRTTMAAHRGSSERFTLSESLTEALKELSRREGVTVFMTLLAAWQVLLARYSGQDDICVGTPIANRNRMETESLIGFFVNTLVMRLNLSGNPSFNELLERARAVCLGAYAHQDMPFEKLVEELPLERSLHHSPLFQVMFSLQNAPMQPLELPGLKLSLMQVPTYSAKFDLLLIFQESENCLTATLDYDTDLFDLSTIQRMIRHFQTLLEGIVTDPGQAFSALPLLSAGEREQVLREWNETTTAYPRERCVHELFEEQVEVNPEAVALVCGEVELSYEELNGRANQLAHYLRGLGVGAEVVVGLCLERSVEMVVGVLGILKAGGAYLPLDPQNPLERLRFMLEDAGVPVLLTQQHLVSSWQNLRPQIICLDTDWGTISQCSRKDLGVAMRADNLAYVMYTSGSTGTPKGVSVVHRNIVRLVKETDYVEFGAEEVFLQMAPLSFDASTFELWGSLLNGAKLVIMAPQLPTLAELGEVLERYEVTTLWLTAGLFHLLVDEGVEHLGGVRQLLAGGDALSVAHVKRVLAGLGEGRRLINGYGPTEGTTFSCCHGMEKESQIGGTVPIGRPIANTEVYVLDQEQQPVPVGVAGELYLGGDGLARGYLNRPELTAKKFVPHPFSEAGGARLYRTGDRVRFLAGGELEFLGRLDQQVKLRGYRIELGEIEATLTEHGGVKEAVVVAEADGVGEKRLVAYVVLDPEQPPAVSDLRVLLQRRLPEYMVPGSIMVLPEMPLTANGKVDRRALPAAETGGVESEFVAPQTPIEEMLAGIWCEILNLERVGVTDDFFELGGHSLLATQLLSRVRDTFQVDVALRHVFEQPRLAEFAVVLQGALGGERAEPAPPIVPVSRAQTLPLSFAQQRLWFIEQLEPTAAAYHISQIVRITGGLSIEALENAFNEVVRRHEILRTVFVVRNGEPEQVINPILTSRLPVIDLSTLPEDERETAIVRECAAEARQPFDLEHGPLVRLMLLRLSDEDCVLVVTMHHIVTDGWSFGILVREITTLYQAFVSNSPSPLPELPIQYADYAYWQRQLSHGEVDEKELDYWRRQLGGPLPILELATDRPRPPQLSYRGASLSFAFSASLTYKLNQLSRKNGSTLFMTLLAGFQTLLHRHTGQEDIIVGTPIANRQRVEIENLIGFFVNTLAMRVDLGGEPTFSELLARVRDVALGAYAHQDTPFEKLVQELQPDRDLSRNPLFQVLFALQNAPSERLELPDLTLAPQEFLSSATRFDLECLMWEQADQLRGIFVYSEDLFDEATAKRMLTNFEVLLEGIGNAPDERINALPFLSEENERRLVVEWNDTTEAFPREQCIHELVAQQAEKTPDALALLSGTDRLSYRELNQRANQLAHYLKKMGVGPETTVGIMMERSIEMLVSVLGMLKAGGAYLPLDPEYPRERLLFMLEDAGAQILLTERRLLERLLAMPTRVVCPENDAEAIGQEGKQNPISNLTPENLAYVIYTSGSTGSPKAVAMPHRPLVNLIHWQAAHSPAAPRTLQFASLSFDVSFQETFSTWCAGGTLVLVDEESRRDSRELLRTLVEQQIERLFVPYVALQHLAQAAEEESSVPRSLRQVITAGEQLKITKDIRSFFGKLDNCVLDNHYGPSETHLASAFSLDSRPDGWPELPPVGRPISNTQLYVLDVRMQPVPQGVVGDLYIGGDCVARGYLHRPDMTASRFVPNPFASQGGGRLYRTGDLVRYLADGNVQFLGRRDHQVKVRGYRIELGEIESALRRHALVREAVVVADEARAAEKRLVAYVLTDQNSELAASDLRQHLLQHLPEYMTPSTFVFLTQFPLTPSGKINRRALPKPEQIAFGERGAYVAPGTPTEELLASLWADVLGIDQVGLHDNFFELGGHSLVATRLMSRVRQAFRVEIPLRSLFITPTIAGLAETIETEMGAGGDAPAPPLPASREEELPLSFAQERMWFLNQLDPESPTYNISSAVSLRGSLNRRALEQSFTEIVRRHEALRTTFANVDGRVVQVIAPAAPVALEVSELSSFPSAEREIEARRLASAEARKPFDLAEGPLLRARLLQMSDREHVLLLTMHHIVSDGWSIGILVRELTTLYAAFAEGKTPALPKLPIQYADFAIWQRAWLTGEVLERQVSFWKRQLQRPLPVLELPLDRRRPPVQTYHGAQHSLELSAEASKGLRDLSRQNGVTPFMTLLAAFKVLLFRHTGEEDVIVGTPIAGRNRAELEGLIGFLVNTLVLRTDLSGSPTFRELLHRVREVTLEAYQHQELPFEKLVDVLQLPRDPSHTPLFQVMFAFQNTLPAQIAVPGLDIGVMELPDETAKFDLILVMSERDERTVGTIVYNIDLFEAATIERLASHFVSLVEGIVTNPSQRLSELPLLADEERRELLEWSQAPLQYPRDKCIAHLFEEQVERAPEAPALVYQDQQLNYRELNERANQLAHYLRNLGVKPNDLVGLCLERSIEMIVGVLSILKVGGAYLPLDAAYPKDRLYTMLDDAQVKVLLTQHSLASRLPEHTARVVLLDSEGNKIALESSRNPDCIRTNSEDLAYVMYTSGSTGQPKGVCITHRNVIRLVKQANYVSFDSDQIFLQLAPLSFDASTFEIWGSLLNGARLVVMPAHTPTLEELASVLEKERITTLWLTAGLFHQMADYHPGALRSLRDLLAGGDVLSVQHVKRALQTPSAMRLINGYGPTESTTFACCHVMRELSDVGETVAIGRPIANTETYLLDEQMQMVPLGVWGELYIGGDGLARGYLNKPDLTGERFLPNPYSAEAGTRLYRTGDMMRYLAGGTLEFLGRRDYQVKVRGFRIELGEVEFALTQHPAVRDAVVLAHNEVAGDKRLIAYVVTEDAAAASSIELRSFLKDKLPEYMVPSAFVFLEELPLTPNGKVDRRSLPLPNESQDKEDREHLPPRTPVEDMLANIWADVLNQKQVGPNDNFFELGGHSLLATQVITRIRGAFQLELPLKDLFINPTVASLAQIIDGALKEGQGIAGPPLERVSRDQDLPLSFAQQRLWFIDQLEPNNPAYHLPVAVRLRGSLDVTALKRSLTEVMRRHEVLRTVFKLKPTGPVQVVLPATELVVPLIDLSQLNPATREIETVQLCLAEVKRPFDLSDGPLVRVSLLKLGNEEYVLQLVMHHIVGDAWSLEILVREVIQLYQAFSAGQSSPLLELSVQYADYAFWQREWLQGETLAKLLAYWKPRLEGAPALLELPADRPRPAVQSPRGSRHTFAIAPELTQALKKLSQREGATIFMTLLAAFQTLLYRYTGQEDIVVGADVNNRTRLETEGMIGFFINMLVLRTNVSGNPTFKELLARVRQIALGAYAHQEMPLEKLVEELQPDRNLSYSPLFQVVFNFNNGSTQPPALPGLQLSPLPLDFTEVKFDLSLFIWDSPESLSGMWTYSTDLFEADRIRCMHEHFVTLLQSIVEHPEHRLNTLEYLTEAEKEAHAVAKRKLKQANLQKFKGLRPQTVMRSSVSLIQAEMLYPGETLPLLIRPDAEEVELAAWAKDNLAFIDTQLLKHGALLFRDFGVRSMAGFAQFTGSISPELLDYSEPSSPRTHLQDKIYTSTEYPADQWIQLHNEMSYAHAWPRTVFFFCDQPAQQGGETPIAYSRKVFQLLDPKIRQRFMQRKVMYVRNFGDGLDLPWQSVFHTSDKAAVADYCRNANVEFEWKNGRLKTRQVRQAVIRHPQTGETVWFNQAHAFHVSTLDAEVRKFLLSEKTEDDFPRNAYYGDGSRIESSVIEEIREAYRRATVTFAWKPGDILILDNMRVAHGRAPFAGARKVLVAMSGRVSNLEVDTEGELT